LTLRGEVTTQREHPGVRPDRSDVKPGGIDMSTKALSAKSFSRIVRMSGFFFTVTVLIATPALAR
jgi:hypothetical protein